MKTLRLSAMSCFIVVQMFMICTSSAATDGVFVRFKLVEPADTTWYVQLGGYIHKPNWYLPRGVVPAGANRDAKKRVASGQFSDWFDLKKHAGDLLHGRMSRAGGVAEFPNVTAQFVTTEKHGKRKVIIELATAPDAKKIAKRFEENFAGDQTSFLVSPELVKDAKDLECASEMTARRLKWALAATGGKRASPTNLIIQTSFWGPQRSELNVLEAKVLWLLGFNVVGGQRPEVRAAYPKLRVPGHTHRVDFGPAATQPQIDALMKSHAAKNKQSFEPGVPFGLADEICARPGIGKNAVARKHFHQWLADQRIKPESLGVQKLEQVEPLETPDAFKEAEKKNAAAARRVFYYTSRFRQLAGTERIRWHTEAFHKYFPKGPITSTLVADHPYFGGTGLGMGMVPNTAWGGAPLALDWFDLARKNAVDMIGIEDWLGLQYMYGPGYTWEGFQLMGFQASMFRSGSRATLPIIAWITPSDETNLRLKSHSALCQGAKHFFYWTYGPTATSTENYWSDLRGSYDGIARVTKQLAASEHIIAPGKTRPTKVALMYSISSDLWQPFGYIHMLERRGTYLSLVHDQYLVDMLTEEDVVAGRLKDYDVFYVTDPCVATEAAKKIRAWVTHGGRLYGSCAAGSRNEFNEPSNVLDEVFGIQRSGETTVQPGEYRVRGRLNDIVHLDQLTVKEATGSLTQGTIGVIGTRTPVTVKDGRQVGTFSNGKPGVVTHAYGQGGSMYFATTPGVSYIKDARFVAKELKEKWPAQHRNVINAWAKAAEAQPLVKLSEHVVEAGVYDAASGTALVLANFTYEPIDELHVAIPVHQKVKTVSSADSEQQIRFQSLPASASQRADGFSAVITFTTKLGLDDIILLHFNKSD